MLGREARNAGEFEPAVCRERVADAQRAAIHHANHVARPRLLHRRTLARQELLRAGEPQRLAGAHMRHLKSGLEAAGADAHERDAVPVLGIHVRLNLEHEAGERRVRRIHEPRCGLARRGRRRELHEFAQERLDAEVRQRAGKKHR